MTIRPLSVPIRSWPFCDTRQSRVGRASTAAAVAMSPSFLVFPDVTGTIFDSRSSASKTITRPALLGRCDTKSLKRFDSDPTRSPTAADDVDATAASTPPQSATRIPDPPAAAVTQIGDNRRSLSSTTPPPYDRIIRRSPVTSLT